MTVNAPTSSRARLASRWLAGIGLVTAAVTVASWFATSSFDVGAHPSLLNVKFNVAVALVLIAASTLALTSRAALRRLAAPLALGAVVIGVATIAQYALGADFGIDNLIVQDPSPSTPTTVPGRMSLLAAFSALLLGGAALLQLAGRQRVAAWSAGAALVLAGSILLDAIYGARPPSFLIGTTTMAVGTAGAVVSAAIALMLATPDVGLARLFLRHDLAGMVARRVMAAAALIAVIVGWLQLAGQRAGLFDAAYGLTLTVLATVLLFAAVIAWVTGMILRLEADRHAAERGVRDREQLFRTLAAEAPVGIVITTAEGSCTYANEAWAEMTGRPASSALGAGWAEPLHPEDLDRITAAWAAATRDGRNFNETYRFLRADGSVRWVNGRTASLSDEHGITGHVGIVNDVTDQRDARDRLAALAGELQRSNRELQDFASAASHDLQEPLRKIQAFGDRLAGRYGDELEESGRDYLSRMIAAATRMQDLITGLLEFSRVATRAHEPQAVDLGPLMQAILEDLEQRIVESGGRVEIGALPSVEADPLQMRQLFQNLIGNALKYRRPDVAPTVRVSGAREGERVRISVADDGIGFDQAQADKIFVPFQRLHARSEFEGTGMGLAICRRIVDRHGGTIAVTSAPGVGTTFRVDLPACSVAERMAA